MLSLWDIDQTKKFSVRANLNNILRERVRDKAGTEG